MLGFSFERFEAHHFQWILGNYKHIMELTHVLMMKYVKDTLFARVALMITGMKRVFVVVFVGQSMLRALWLSLWLWLWQPLSLWLWLIVVVVLVVVVALVVVVVVFVSVVFCKHRDVIAFVFSMVLVLRHMKTFSSIFICFAVV